jgi:hypothetical protein
VLSTTKNGGEILRRWLLPEDPKGHPVNQDDGLAKRPLGSDFCYGWK